MKFLKQWFVPLLAVVAGLTVALGQAVADDDEQRRKKDWQQRYEQVLSRVKAAEARIATSRLAIRKARQRDRLKGQHRTEIMTELNSAEEELATARQLLEELPEAARQAGVPPGWLREIEERRDRAS